MPTIDALPDPAKILVVDLGFLGDTIHLIPALWAIRQNLPKSNLQVVTTPVGAEVLAMTRCVDHVWVYPLGKPSPPWWRHLDLQKRLRDQRFDLAINLSGADRSLFVTAFSGSRLRVTRGGRKLKAWQRWLAGAPLPAQPRTIPVFEQRRRCLEVLGFRLETEPRFDLQPLAPEQVPVAANIPRGAIHVSINASTPFKEWPLSSWAELASRLLEAGFPAIVVTASPASREQQRLEALANTIRHPGLIVLRAALSIAGLTTVLKQCRGHVGTDSGVTHVAMALGLPTVSIFREYPGLEEWRPTGPHHLALTAACPCAQRDEVIERCATRGTACCLAEISVNSVVEVVSDLFRR